MSLYDIYEISSSAIFTIPLFFAAFFCIFDIWHFIKSFSQKKKPKPDADGLFLDMSFKTRKITIILLNFLFIFITLFSNNCFVIMLGCEDIRVMPEGTYCYYVLATNKKDNTYTLPAKIEKVNETYDFGEGDIKHSQDYYIKNVYFKNGGYLYFGDECELYKNKKTGKFTATAYDQNEKEWKIELTDNKTSHPKVTETNPLRFSTIIFIFIIASCFLLSSILHFLHLLKTKDYGF